MTKSNKLSVTCDKDGAVIHLSGETAPMESAVDVDEAVIHIIMDLNDASVSAKGAIRKRAAKLHA